MPSCHVTVSTLHLGLFSRLSFSVGSPVTQKLQSFLMATERKSEEPPTMSEISAGGDITFVVGPEETRLRVCSTILKNASKYFSALLGPNFREGQDIGKGIPKEILLPEENAQSLEIIFNVLHLRNEAVPKSLSPISILEIAIAADKFDCTVAMQHVSTIWLSPKKVTDAQELGRLMTAAYVFDNAEAFSDVTRWIIMHHQNSYLALMDSETENWIPWRTLRKC